MPAFLLSLLLCADLNLRTASLGTQCATGKGGVFTRVDHEGAIEAWMTQDKRVWIYSSDQARTQAQVTAECGSINSAVPTPADFRAGEIAGFREVLPNMDKFCLMTSDNYVSGPFPHIVIFWPLAGRPVKKKTSRGPTARY